MTVGIARFMDALESTWDAHLRALYDDRDVDAALTQASARASIRHLPMGTGADGRSPLQAFLADDVLPHLPADLSRIRISRTVDRWGLVDETTVRFTHDRELPWLAPGIAPTHRAIEALVVMIVRFDKGALGAQRWLWDHAALTAGLGLGEIATAR